VESGFILKIFGWLRKFFNDGPGGVWMGFFWGVVDGYLDGNFDDNL
jgi:hypothetical protein